MCVYHINVQKLKKLLTTFSYKQISLLNAFHSNYSKSQHRNQPWEQTTVHRAGSRLTASEGSDYTGQKPLKQSNRGKILVSKGPKFTMEDNHGKRDSGHFTDPLSIKDLLLPPKCPPVIFVQLPLAYRCLIVGHLPDLDIFF